MPKATGRPLKYRKLIECLADEVVYTPASIVINGIDLGLLNQEEELTRASRVKIRHTLARFAKNHRFPVEGDGSVILPGQSLTRGWSGGRWKGALPEPRGSNKAAAAVGGADAAR